MDIPDPVTLNFVESVEDFDILQELCVRFGINENDLATIEAYKDAIKKYIQTRDCGSRKKKLLGAISDAGEKDKDKRDRLRKIIEKIRDIFPETNSIRQTLITDLLQQDGVLTHLSVRDDCSTRIDNLSNNECTIIISGETSAGKSSLLNLLCGEEILPSHVLPCTSSITVIRYSDTRSAKVLFTSGEQKVIKNLDASGLAELKNIAFIQESATKDQIYQRRRDGHDIAEIQVNLPLPFLKSGLVLVDTPGIGENEFLENYLMEYIRTHEILGFMYVIMTNSDGGIQEDRLVNLLTLIVKEQNASNHLMKFNPKAALFICNKWDLVEDQDKDAVKQNALRKLAKCWPEFEPSQVLMFSTELAKKDRNIHEDYIGEEYTRLLEAMRRLVDTAVDQRSSAAFKWVGSLLERSYYYLKTVVKRLDLSEREKVEKSNEVKRKLETLRNKTDGVINRLRVDMEAGVKDICKKAKAHLKKDTVKVQITKGWNKRELPDLEVGSGGWGWIKAAIETAFNNRVVNQLEEWDSVEKNIPKQADNMAREARLSLSDLKKELVEIEKDAEKNDDDTSMVSFTSLASSYRCQSLQDLYEEDFEVSLPSKMLMRLLSPIYKKTNEAKLKDYRKKPGRVAEKKCEKLLKKMLSSGNEDMLEDIVQQLMQRPMQFIRHLENRIPKLIRANEMLLGELERICATHNLHQANFEEMMTNIERTRRQLASYGETFMYANDFRGEEIRLIKNKTTSSITYMRTTISDLLRLGSSQETLQAVGIPRGLWTSVYRGICSSCDQEKHVSVRVYSNSAGVGTCFKEVGKLRCMLHTDVCLAEFLGIHELQDTPTPAFVYAGHLISASRYLSQYVGDTGLRTKLLTLFNDTCNGLQYLHAKGLVHMELTQDTITVSEKGDVQLSGCCIPRKANIPNTTELAASGYVYLAPEVLMGETYTASSDVYAAALLLLELLLRCTVYQEFRRLTVLEFVQKINPISMLKDEVNSDILPEYLQRMVKQCLLIERKSRPEIATLAVGVKKGASSGIFHLGRPIATSELFKKSWRKGR